MLQYAAQHADTAEVELWSLKLSYRKKSLFSVLRNSHKFSRLYIIIDSHSSFAVSACKFPESADLANGQSIRHVLSASFKSFETTVGTSAFEVIDDLGSRINSEFKQILYDLNLQYWNTSRNLFIATIVKCP